MPLVPIKVPAGAVRNGTEYEAKGRWRDVNLVRWHEGSTKPHSGWSEYSGIPAKTTAASASEKFPGFGYDDPVGIMGWVDNSENARLIWAGQNGGCKVMDATGGFTNLTPGGITSGNNWATIDAFGEIPIVCFEADGGIYEWDLNTANNLTAVTNAPTDAVSIVVTDERFIFAIKKREIAWCDREDRTTWTAAATNQAGSFSLDTEGEMMRGIQMRGEVLLLGTSDAYVARYIGYPDVWEFRQVGRCSLLGANAAARVADIAYWWGEDGFYQYSGGYVSDLQCDVWDFVSADLDPPNNTVYNDDRRRVFAWHHRAFNEVVWQYSSTAATDFDKYVAYNYLLDVWSYGESPHNVVAEPGAFSRPLAAIEDKQRFFDTLDNNNEGWTLGANWQITGGALSQTAPTDSDASVDPVTGAQADAPYLVSIIHTGWTAGTLTVTFGATSFTVDSADNAMGLCYSDGASPTLTLSADGTYDGSIDTVFVYRAHVLEVDSGDYTYFWATNDPYAKTGPFELGDGERRVHVTKLYPDEQDSGELQFTFGHREYPTATETVEAAITAANPTDVRFSGRQFTMKVEPVETGADWRSGTHRLDIRPGGKR